MSLGNKTVRTTDDLSSLRAENDDLRNRLAEAEETLEAIRTGEVDALVIGDQIYTWKAPLRLQTVPW
jgi:hypothetical protein